MKILISNDDGVMAPGIHILANTLSTIATIDVMAPDRNRSGASNSLTLSRPLRVSRLDNGFYSVEGTPTDCVHLGLTGFIDSDFDMVVSGINQGANLGDDVLYSGTVAAAMEGRNLGLPAIAISMIGHCVHHYETGAHIAKQLIMKLRTHRLPAHTILNVNVPDRPLNDIKGIQVTRLGKRHTSAPMIKALDPRGEEVYWVGPAGEEADAGVGTDFYAVNQGYVSVTPLQLDMTHYKLFDTMVEWVDGLSL
jgi:5'-nucleotidase